VSISIPSQAVSSSDPERVQLSQESLCPSPMEISVQKTGKRGRSDPLESLVEETAKRHFSDSLGLASEDCILPTLVYWLLEDNYTLNSLALTCKKNFQNVPAVVRTVLKGRQDVDYQATEMWRKRHILANEELLQKELASLLTSFGLPLFCTEENKQQTIDRITTILNSLKERNLFTDAEKRHFATLSAKEIFEKPTLLYLLLQTADRCNLVLLFTADRCDLLPLFRDRCYLNNEKTFPQKVAAVFDFLRDNREQIQEVWSNDLWLSNVPNEVCNLTQLKKLKLINPEIKKLPEWIENLTQLQELNLSFTHITELPETIGKLIQLEKLNLSFTHITELPESIGNLIQLQRLIILGEILLTKLPESISKLTKLFDLDLGGAYIKKLPESIGNLIQLQRLRLSNTQITELPESIGNLAQLEYLDLSNTQITELPESIGNLAQLEYLDLSNTQITELPEALSRLPKLVAIYLSSNDTVQIPASLARRIDRC